MALIDAKPRELNLDDFEVFLAEHLDDDSYYELIDGAIVEKPMPTQLHGFVVGVLNGEFYIYFKQNPIGFPAPEVRYQVPGDLHNSRQPDLSIVLDTRTPLVEKGAVKRMPDIVIEVKSPTDRILAFRERASYYLANGVRLVLLIYPLERFLEVYRPDSDVEILTERQTLTGYDLLPGFSLAVKDLFPHS